MDSNIACMQVNTTCNNCAGITHLFSNQCSSRSITALSRIIDIKGPYANGERIITSGQPAHAIYVVRSGTVKCERASANGGMHVVGFYLTGDLFGIEDLGAQHHSYDAVALEESHVCKIPINELEQLFLTHPDLQHCFLNRIGDRLRSSERLLTDSFTMNAKYRLSVFLKEFYNRSSQRGYLAGRSVMLPMHKIDIASHLGMSPETLSRLLREMEEEGSIRNGLRKIELVEPDK